MDFFERFPDMKPVTAAPSMQTINGIGTSAYGSRDFDPETGTYVKTLWVTVVFIPIVPLAAYRVADAPNGGWYFLGKVPVSGAAKSWALFLLLAVLGVSGYFWWDHHTGTPSYHAGQKMARAHDLRQQGKVGDAARLYREVADSNTEHAGPAVAAVSDILNQPDFAQQADLEQAAEVLRAGWELRDRRDGLKDIFPRGMKVVTAHLDANPTGALAVLAALEQAVPKGEDILPTRQKLLERLTREQPDNVDLAAQLAVVYEQTGQRDRCLALLEPLKNKLGTSDGARALGMVYFEKGRNDEALALLQPYVDTRLKSFRDTEQRFDAAAKNFQTKLIDSLKDGSAKDFDFKSYEASPRNKQNQMVNDYVARRFNQNPELRQLQAALQRDSVVVPAVLDLGMAQLARGQRLADPGQRKAELERAEKTLLSVRGQAGEQAGYRLSLAAGLLLAGQANRGTPAVRGSAEVGRP